MIAAQKTALAPEAACLRGAADQKVAEHLVKTMGVAIEEALHQVVLRHVRLLPPELELEFDDAALGVVAVKDVMAQPGKYVDETLADPLEGISYGRCKAKVMRGDSGQLIATPSPTGGSVPARPQRADAARPDCRDRQRCRGVSGDWQFRTGRASA